MLNIMRIAGTGMQAENLRLNAIASNIANAGEVHTPGTQGYQAKKVVFEATLKGVQVKSVETDKTPGKLEHNPGHPLADAGGYIEHSNVNPIEEMLDMISASRSYQMNVEVFNNAKQLTLKTIQLLRG